MTTLIALGGLVACQCCGERDACEAPDAGFKPGVTTLLSIDGEGDDVLKDIEPSSASGVEVVVGVAVTGGLEIETASGTLTVPATEQACLALLLDDAGTVVAGHVVGGVASRVEGCQVASTPEAVYVAGWVMDGSVTAGSVVISAGVEAKMFLARFAEDDTWAYAFGEEALVAPYALDVGADGVVRVGAHLTGTLRLNGDEVTGRSAMLVLTFDAAGEPKAAVVLGGGWVVSDRVGVRDLHGCEDHMTLSGLYVGEVASVPSLPVCDEPSGAVISTSFEGGHRWSSWAACGTSSLRVSGGCGRSFVASAAGADIYVDGERIVDEGVVPVVVFRVEEAASGELGPAWVARYGLPELGSASLESAVPHDVGDRLWVTGALGAAGGFEGFSLDEPSRGAPVVLLVDPNTGSLQWAGTLPLEADWARGFGERFAVTASDTMWFGATLEGEVRGRAAGGATSRGASASGSAAFVARVAFEGEP